MSDWRGRDVDVGGGGGGEDDGGEVAGFAGVEFAGGLLGANPAAEMASVKGPGAMAGKAKWPSGVVMVSAAGRLGWVRTTRASGMEALSRSAMVPVREAVERVRRAARRGVAARRRSTRGAPGSPAASVGWVSERRGERCTGDILVRGGRLRGGEFWGWSYNERSGCADRVEKAVRDSEKG